MVCDHSVSFLNCQKHVRFFLESVYLFNVEGMCNFGWPLFAWSGLCFMRREKGMLMVARCRMTVSGFHRETGKRPYLTSHWS